MSNIAIAVKGLGKFYRIAGCSQSGQTFREAIIDGAKGPIRRMRRIGKPPLPEESVWALKDVSFDVNVGEVVGIIGRNGAGKSTLLKILSRITQPTTGEALIKRRVGALLEVGTGFHPELTGRENIFLNGAILGMSRTEIRRKFDEIVAFAEIEKFIDTPIKRYSSGMHVRLAFGVAAHLEPDIMVVDEVLAVGDAVFQKKCLGKMEDVATGGRTVLFVSHNMAAVKSLCQRAILLEKGGIAYEGDVNDVVDTYLSSETETSKTGIVPDDARRSGTGEIRVQRVELLDRDDVPLSQVYLGQPIRVAMTLEALRSVTDAVVGVGISSPHDGLLITTSYSVDGDQPDWTFSEGWHKVCLDLDVTFIPRTYTLDVEVHHSDGRTIDFVQSTLEFVALNVAQDSADRYRWTKPRGFIRPSGHWHEPLEIGNPVEHSLAEQVTQ